MSSPAGIPIGGSVSLPMEQTARLAPPVGRVRVRRRMLLVGTGPRAVRLARALTTQGQSVIGTVDNEQLPHLNAEFPDVPWLGPLDAVGPQALANRVDEICVALPLRSCFDQWQQTQTTGREIGIPVSLHVDIIGDPQCARLAPAPGGALLRCHLHPTSMGMAPFWKRVFDIVGASAALVLLSPLLLLAAAIVKLTSTGPLIFRQLRVGRGRRVFGMLKFRTMQQDAEARRAEVQSLNHATGIMFKIARDPRLTVVGPFLRRASIDELPQLVNVLKGEMSLVGPRPLPTWVYEQIDDPFFHRRFSVMPGLTGLWQVHGRPQEYRLMAQYDLQYVDQWSLWLDLKILFRTIPVVLCRRGAQ
jgi:exopolysaccharide biosynthesis polyprenyl glycosylphosphotransferase